MKIFSNFDTKRRQDSYNEMVEKYGEKNVLVLKKSFLFLFVKVLLPVFGLFLSVFGLRIIIFINMGDNITIKTLFTLFMLILYGFLLMISSVLKHFIDYKMDFSLVTPEYLTRYNQTGFFRRDIRSSYVRNIKTITIIKNDPLYSIFDNGNLIFLSEGDRGGPGDNGDGEIVLHYIKNPEGKKKEITRIMKVLN